MIIQVLIPVGIDWLPWYRAEDSLGLKRGMRLWVKFGNKTYCGVVWQTGATPDISEDRILEIEKPAPELSDISEEELKFWEFLSSYYLCRLGEVFKAAYPASRIKSELTRNAIKDNSPLPPTDKKATCGRRPKPVLLIGTSRLDKYIQAIGECLEKGLSTLILIPEIAISERLQKSLEEHFKERTILCNSTQTAVQRRRTAETLRNSAQAVVVIGTRCAVFLPFRNLGLIIVDEEQDPSFKQTEPDPRMNVRDAALVLGLIHGAGVILGSSAPSLESIFNCRSGKFNMENVPVNICTPIIDVSEERGKNGMIGHFSRKLISATSGVTKQLLFIRGWEKSAELDSQIEELFPGRDVRVLTAHEAISLPDSEIRKAGLTAILQADALFPRENFRADERAFQLICRLRCTFPEIPLVIQTAKSKHPVFLALTGAPYIDSMLAERKLFNLPPFSRNVDVSIRGFGRAERLFPLLHGRLSAKLGVSASMLSGTTARFSFPRSSAEEKKAVLLREVTRFEKENHIPVQIDVDPIN